MLPPEMRSIGRSHAIRFLLSVLYGIKPQNPLEFVAVIRTIHATLTHVGYCLPVQTHHLSPIKWVMKMHKWFTKFTAHGLKI